MNTLTSQIHQQIHQPAGANVANSHAIESWLRPTISPEHGVLLVLLGAAVTGAALAQHWTPSTSLACLAAFLAVQAEYPLVVQIKQRRSWKPRYVLWTVLYGTCAGVAALWLCWHHPVLLWVCGGAGLALGIDVAAVLRRRQKAVLNEIVMFTAICLTTLLTYGATTGTLTVEAVGFWVMNSLFFASAIFSIKLRKVKGSSIRAGLIYHGGAVAALLLLFWMGWLPGLSALAFAVALLKFAVILWQRDWYCHCRFEYIARFETYFALSYTALAALAVLPAKLSL